MTRVNKSRRNSLTYKDAGVDIEAGDALVKRITPLARSTRRPGAEADLGGFGGLFDLKAAGFRDPVLVASTDGVGTKLKIAIECGRFDGLGQDLVAMCVNDIVVQGAEPLFFLDYYATGKLDVDAAASVIEGIARACKESGCALIGGETAEMPGLYRAGDFDLAGFAVGAVERDNVLPARERMQEGDVIIGVESSGIHSNGLSLARRIVGESGLDYGATPPFQAGGGGASLGEVLLKPTRLYVRSGLEAIRAGATGLAHITGGGITENLPRVLPDALGATIDLASWQLPALFGWFAREAGVEGAEMLRTFNCGVGLIVIAPQDHANAVLAAFERHAQPARKIGVLSKGDGEPRVRYSGSLRL
jgi:phosphoribosylformylglycinamidine cyclo-ligase